MKNMTDKHFTSATDKFFLKRLSSEYSLFGEYEDEIFRAASAISEDTALLEKINKLSEYVSQCTCSEAKNISLPKTENKKINLMIPLFILLPSVSIAEELYKKRGFPKNDIVSLIGENFRSCISLTEINNGFPGIDEIYYGWLCLYVKCEIFDHGIFNFQPQKFKSDIVVLKNKITEIIIPIATCGKFHSSGLVFGSAGCTDEEGSFEVKYFESKDSFEGHPAIGGKVSSAVQIFKKSEWECILRKGEDVLGIHIPHGVKLTDENIRKYTQSGFETAKKTFPEYSFKGMCCYSWLLDPTLKDILGENSNISVFSDKFVKFPVPGNGMSVFGFVFPRNYKSFEELSENTRLERSLKKLYLNGGYIYSYAGILI